MKLLKWQPAKETIVAFTTGLLIILLSALMIPFNANSWIRIVIHDIGMICLAGIMLPLSYMQKSGRCFAELGLTHRRWYVFLPINLILGVFLLYIFIYWVPPTGFSFDSKTLITMAVILCTGVFEVIFFYGFLRTLFERAFGVIPAILLAAVFYSFHHIGFQPEFLQLFFVGVMYAVIYRAGNSVLLIYPFFWGVGASYNVLIQSQKVSTIMYPGIRLMCLLVSFVLMFAWFWFKSRNSSGKSKKY